MRCCQSIQQISRFDTIRIESLTCLLINAAAVALFCFVFGFSIKNYFSTRLWLLMIVFWILMAFCHESRTGHFFMLPIIYTHWRSARYVLFFKNVFCSSQKTEWNENTISWYLGQQNCFCLPSVESIKVINMWCNFKGSALVDFMR